MAKMFHSQQGIFYLINCITVNSLNEGTRPSLLLHAKSIPISITTLWVKCFPLLAEVSKK